MKELLEAVSRLRKAQVNSIRKIETIALAMRTLGLDEASETLLSVCGVMYWDLSEIETATSEAVDELASRPLLAEHMVEIEIEKKRKLDAED